jgi:hypothetical protein
VTAQPTFIDQPLEEFPATLSEVGLFASLEERTLSQRVFEYVPRFPLWTNGLRKQRAVAVPEGETIDAEDSETWSFPVGTLFFKTFSLGDQPVETRILRIGEEERKYAIYRWDEAGSEAELLEGKRSVGVALSDDAGDFEHAIPSHRECQQCHESRPALVLGFDAIQLMDDADYEESTLREAQDAGLLQDPALPATIEEDARTSEFLGFLYANCVHCHNGFNGLSSSFDMRPPIALENLVGRETGSSAGSIGIRVIPGDPEGSVLYQAISGETNDPELKEMPPLGVQRRDFESIERVYDWISALPSDE